MAKDLVICMRDDLDSRQDPLTLRACDRWLASNKRDALQRAAVLKQRSELKFTSDPYGAINDLTEALSLTPNEPELLIERGQHLRRLKLFSKSRADFDAVLRANPKHVSAYWYLMHLHLDQGNIQDALEAISTAKELSGRPQYRVQRGVLLLRLGRLSDAMTEAQDVVEGDGGYPKALFLRASVFDQRRVVDKALADYRRALAEDDSRRKVKNYSGMLFSDEQKIARQRIEDLSKLQAGSGEIVRVQLPESPSATATGGVTTTDSPSVSRRLALVVGNSNYVTAPRLNNPARDTTAIAGALRRIGFAEVIERTDLDRLSLEAALKDFGDRAADADWAVVYYSGHGIQVDGSSFIVPVDAKLARAGHVEDEAIPLDRVLSKVRDARKLRLLILDACRDNPFLPKMQQVAGATRSLGRGLSRIEPSSGMLVVYSARDGQLAQDGTGANSPFTEALLQHIEEPGLEINLLFRKVRDTVLAKTRNQQEPFTYGSLPGEAFYFKPAR